MSHRKLLESGSESEEEVSLQVNENYAERYQNWREKEEYQKLKDKYGEQVLSEASELSYSDDESDSEDNPTDEEGYDNQLNQEIFDEPFLRVYGALKRKDPALYDENVKFYTGGIPVEKKARDQDSAGKASTKEAAPKLTLADYHVKLVTEKKGVTEEDEVKVNEAIENPSYYEELYSIKNELRAAVHDNDSDDDLLTGLRTVDKTQVAGSSKKIDLLESAGDENLGFLKEYWQKDSSKSEAFIRDYILNKKYIDKPKSKRTAGVPYPADDSESSDTDDEAAASVEPTNLLSSAKHRFEEPGGSEINRFPRVVDSSRDLPKMDTRAAQRQEKREKKKKQKEEELNRLSELKKKEIQKKLDKLKEISGNDKFLDKEINIDALIDDDKDFDPDKYDQYMSALFGEKYYADDVEGEKPIFEYVKGVDDEIEEEIDSRSKALVEIASEMKGSADESDSEEEPEVPATKKKGKKKRKRKEGIVSANKIDKLPLYEDVIGGDLPTRFKYRNVPSNLFGLTSEEILLADERELNNWVSLKKACQYRNDDEERYDALTYERKGNDLALKKKIFKSLYGDDTDNVNYVKNEDESNNDKETTEQAKKKKKRRKRKAKNGAVEEPTANVDLKVEKLSPTSEAKEATKLPIVSGNSKDNAQSKRKRGNNKRKPRGSQSVAKKPSNENPSDLTVDRLRAYGLSNNVIKKRKLV